MPACTVVLAVAVQPKASVTVTVYVPTPRLFTVAVVAPVFQRYVYGEVPPLAVAVTDPVDVVVVLVFVDEAETERTVGEVCTTALQEVDAVHPFDCVTVTV